ncbi:MAG: cytochrome c [Rhodospirillales bacterium]
MRIGIAGFVALVILAGVGFWGWETVFPDYRADPNDVAQVERGRVVYQQHCASCHGANLEGQADWRYRKPDGRLPAPPHDETGHTWHHPDEHLVGITKYGPGKFVSGGYESDMPAFDDVLPDEDIWAAIAFIKSTWTPEVLARQSKTNQ